MQAVTGSHQTVTGLAFLFVFFFASRFFAGKYAHGNYHDHNVEHPPGDLLVVTQQAAGWSLSHRNLARQDLANAVMRDGDVNVLNSVAAEVICGDLIDRGSLVGNGLVFSVD